MKKLASAFALTAALALGSVAHADPIVQSLAPTEISASSFNSMFTPLPTAPAMMSNFQFQGAPVSGVMESQVFQGTGAAAGLYAYAYQLGVNTGATQSTGDPAHVDSASFHFGATPVGTDLTNSGHTTFSYVVKDGQVGDLSLPQAAPGGVIQTPTELSWSPTAHSGDLRAQFENQAAGAPPLTPGANSATFIVISSQPQTENFVNLQSSDPQVQPNGNYTLAYAPAGGTIAPVPIPEPATVLGWAGMVGALALVRKVRKVRAAA